MGRLLLVLFSIASLSAFAQEPLSVRQAVERALSSHPLIEAAGRRVEAATAAKTQAALGLNPRLVLQHENTRPGYAGHPFVYNKEVDQFAYLTQSFELAGKRDKRVAFAESGRQRTELERSLLRQQIAARVSVAYWAALGAKRLHSLLVESAANLQQVVEYHEIRVKEGALAEADLLRVRVEAQRLNVDISHALLAAERARIQLFREMGEREFPPVQFADTVEAALAEKLPADLAAALAKRVEIQVARAQVEQARAQQVVQTSLATPNVEVLFGLKRTAGLNTLLGGVQWDLPFRNRNQGNIEVASAEIRLAEANLAATEALVRAEFESALSTYQLYRHDIETFLEPLQRQAGETYRIADAAYREGGADLLRLLDARRVGIESRIAYIQGLTGVREAQAELQAAMGVQP